MQAPNTYEATLNQRQQTAVTEPQRLTPASYAKQISLHAQTTASNSLYQGSDWNGLNKWLSEPSRVKSPGPSKPGFARIYILPRQAPKHTDGRYPSVSRQATKPICGSELSLPLETSLPLQSIEGNVLLFFRGYPSSEWLKETGARFRIEPEVFYRHLSFFQNPMASMRQEPFKLPSSQRSIFQFTITTVGQYTPCELSLSRTRMLASRRMETYQTGLKDQTNWTLGDSIVREFSVHNEKIFSLEQLITIYSSKDTEDDTCTTLVWLDCGDDLFEGRNQIGPWSHIGTFPTTFPVTMYRRGVSLKSSQHRVVKSDTNQVHGSKGLPQSISLLPLFYGRSLNATQMSEDPFYALHELFNFWATSETQFLNVVQSGLQSTISLSPVELLSKMVDNQNTLVFYDNILKRHIESISDVLMFIEARIFSDWPQSNANKPQMMAERLKFDVEYLLTKSKTLQNQCESAMSTLSNQANLQEAKRAVSESGRMYRLSLLVSVFIPLSFSSSIFGMGFVEFGTTTQGVLVFFLVTIPIFALSLAFFSLGPGTFGAVLSSLGKIGYRRKNLV